MRKSKANNGEEWVPGALKKSESHTAEKCIIHCSDSNEKLSRLQLYESWKVLLDAAKTRKYQPLLEKALTVSENEMPNIVYHRRCRSIFTLKDTLKRIQNAQN